jgi:DNA-binding transcriptional LysR family regulator
MDDYAVQLYDEPLYVAVHQDHHLAKATTVKIQQLEDEDFVNTSCRTWWAELFVSNICLSAGFVPKKARVQSRKVSQLQLVAANIGICIVPAEFKNIVPEQVRLIALILKCFSDVFMVWNSHADDAW